MSGYEQNESTGTWLAVRAVIADEVRETRDWLFSGVVVAIVVYALGVFV